MLTTISIAVVALLIGFVIGHRRGQRVGRWKELDDMTGPKRFRDDYFSEDHLAGKDHAAR